MATAPKTQTEALARYMKRLSDQIAKDIQRDRAAKATDGHGTTWKRQRPKQ